MTSTLITELLKDNLNKVEVKNILPLLLENHDDIETRITAIKAIEHYNLTSKEIYKIVENLAVSDESPIVRSEAIKVIITCFISDGYSALKYLIENEASFFVIKKFRNELKLKSCEISRCLYNEFIRKYSDSYSVFPEEAEFLFDLDCIKENEKIGQFKTKIKKGHIIILDLAGWNLELLPDSIKALSYLKKLNLWNNYLHNLPKSFGNLSNLEELYLDWNNFRKIPEIDWAKLKSLKKLSLTNNPELHVNNLSFNHELIQYLGKKYGDEGVKDQDVSALIGLELLTGQRIRKLRNKTELNKLYACNYIINDTGNITGLYLYGYYGFQIKRIPNEVFSLNYLKDLIIRNQQIEMIPECINNLSLLKTLDLMGNKLKELPKSLNQLKNLEYLDIEGNHINYIPEIILNSEINLWV